jgi:hypothetical protein
VRVVVWFALAVMFVGCGSPQPSADEQGLLTLSVKYQEPPPGVPRSIGGYAVLGQLVGPDGSVTFTGALDPLANQGQPHPTPPTFDLPGGQYRLDITLRFASDAITVDQNGRVHRDLGPVTSTCTASIPVTPPGLTAVVVTLTGGNSCAITASN